MSSHHPTEVYIRLSREERIHFLLCLAHELTIVARDTYAVGGRGLQCPERLRAINEIQHRILANCRALLENDPARYPDEVLLQIILDHPEDAELQRQLVQTFEHLLACHAPAA